MDLAKFDNRAAAEAGFRLVLIHPDTEEPLGEGDDAPAAIVRGTASRKAQERLKAMTAKNKKKAEAGQSMEDVHRNLIDTAAAFVIRFENVEINGRLAEKPEDVRAILDLTFPIMDRTGVDDDGAPKFEMVNKPFAVQIIEAAGDRGNFSGSDANA